MKKTSLLVVMLISLLTLLFSYSAKSQSLQFNGSDQYVSVPHDDFLRLANSSFSIEAWVNVSSIGSFHTILSKGGGNYAENTAFFFDITSTGKVGLYLSDGVNTALGSSTSGITANAWYHVAVSYDHGQRVATFYINGQNAGTFLYSFTSVGGSDTQPMFIGRQGYDCACNYFNGKIDELRVWAGARLPWQIAASSKFPTDKDVSNLFAYYDFNEGSGSTLNSKSTTYQFLDPDGTLVNSPTWNGTGYPVISFSNYLFFNGTDGVQVSNFSDGSTGQLTIEAWVKRATFSAGYQTVVDFGGDQPFFGFSGNNLVIYNGGINASADFSPYYNKLTHIAVTIANGSQRLYINGQEANYLSGPGTTSYSGTSSSFGIGYNNSDGPFGGVMREVRIWNDIRNETEIAQNLTADLAGSESGLRAYYNFQEGSGTVLNDNTGNGFNGTFLNTPQWTNVEDPVLPVFFTPATTAVQENFTGVVIDVNARLGSGGNDSGIAYSINGTDVSFFSINSSTGVISLNSMLDFESPTSGSGDNNYVFQITAQAGTLSEVQNMTISVLDQSEPPAFSSSSSVSTYENVSQSILDVEAIGVGETIPDEGVTYTISGGVDGSQFSINAQSGELSFKSTPDFEMPNDADGNNQYLVDIQAAHSLGSGTQSIIVSVGDVNEDSNSACLSNPASGASLSFSAFFGQSFKTYCSGKLSKVDFQVFNNLSYDVNTVSIYRGEPDFQNYDANSTPLIPFEITNISGTGIISLDYSSANITVSPGDVFTIILQYPSDIIGIQRGSDFSEGLVYVYESSTSQIITTTAFDTNFEVYLENDPLFESPSLFSYLENNTDVIDLSAVDGSGGATDENITYAISGGDDASAFEIDAATGEVSFQTSPDFEVPHDADVNNVYELSVNATNSSSLIATQNLAITIINVDEFTAPSGTPPDWSNPSSWESGQVPGKDDDVSLPANITISIADIQAVKNLNVQTNTVIEITNGGALAIFGEYSGEGEVEQTREITGTASGGYSIVGSPMTITPDVSTLPVIVYEYDGTVGFTAKTSGSLEPGKGYFLRESLPDGIPLDLALGGEPNTGDISVAVSTAGDGFNLLANPYTAAISVVDFIDNNPAIDGTLYLWDDGGENSGATRGGDYIAVNRMGLAGVINNGGHSGNTGSGVFDMNIGSLQGFFAGALTNGNVTFSQDMQVTTSASNAVYFRVGDEYEAMLPQTITLSLSNGELSNMILLGLAPDATLGRDRGYDSDKFSGNDEISFYTRRGDQEYSIEGLGMIEEREEAVFNLEFDLANAGDYRLRLEEQRNLPENMDIVLIDKVEQMEYRLKELSNITFFSDAIQNNDRFAIKFVRNPILSTPKKIAFSLFGTSNGLNISYPSNTQEEVIITNLAGKQVTKQSISFASGSAFMEVSLLPKELYILTIRDQSIKFLITE